MEFQSNATIAVLGAGAMGTGIAQVAALAGHGVVVIDRDAQALDRSKHLLAQSLTQAEKRGLAPALRDAIQARIGWSTDLAAVAPAALVIEAIVEQIDAKLSLFQALSSHIAPEAVVASNTSSLPIARLAAGVLRPHRFLGLHFFNPVPAMTLVEVIAGPSTDPSVLEAAERLMRRWDKHPVRVADVPGFIVNRVARPYYAEGFVALGEGLPAADIDHALKAAGGFRMGPLALADFIGHDVNYAVAQSVYEAYDGKTRFRPQAAQGDLVARGRLGRKSGHGVYDYAASLPSPNLAPKAAPPRRLAVAAGDDLLAPLAQAAARAGMEMSSRRDLASGAMVIDDITIALGDGRTLASRPGVDGLLDHARDLAAAPTLVFTAASPQATQAAAGLAQAIGRDALFVPDRPGQLVLRALSQLANAAADAVDDEVATPRGVDEAMVHGANHPEGPLAWAGRLGVRRLASALTHIAEATGDPLYRPAAFFIAAATSTAQEIINA